MFIYVYIMSRLSSSPTLLGRDPLSTASRPPRATAPPAAARRSALRRRLYASRCRAKGALAAGVAHHFPERFARAVRLLEAHHGSAARHPLSRASRRAAALTPAGMAAATPDPVDPLAWQTVGGKHTPGVTTPPRRSRQRRPRPRPPLGGAGRPSAATRAEVHLTHSSAIRRLVRSRSGTAGVGAAARTQTS